MGSVGCAASKSLCILEFEPNYHANVLLMSICHLCKEEKQLRNSHIVPEFLYEDLYNDKGHLVGVNGVGPKGRRLLQKGIREPLLCESCEQHINEYCEKPFRAQWFNTSPIPTTWSPNTIYSGHFDYSSFKLFHLSVLFRASVSSLGTYRAISLGPHEERIRKLILSRDPGPTWQYLIFGHAVVHDKTWSLVRIISAPERINFNDHRCYGMMYGGVYWYFYISSHRNRELERIGLQRDGHMPLHAIPWNKIGVIQTARNYLRKE